MKLLVVFSLLLVALIVDADDVDINAFHEKVEGMKLLKKEDDVIATTPDRFSVVDDQAPEATNAIDAAVQTEKPVPIPFNATLTLNLTSNRPIVDGVIVERVDVQKSTEDPLDQVVTLPGAIYVDKSMLPVDIRELLKSQSEKREANAEVRPESDARPLEDDAQKSVKDRLAEVKVTLPEERDIDSLPYGIRELLISQFKKPEANDNVKPESDTSPLGDALIVGAPFPPPPENDEEIIERGSDSTPDGKKMLRGNRDGDNDKEETNGNDGKEGPGLDVDGDLLSLKLSRNGDKEATEATSEKKTRGSAMGKILGGLVKVFGKIAAAKKGEANSREESDAVSDEAVDVKDDGTDVDDVSEKTTSRGGAMVKILGGLAKLLTRVAAKKKNEANEDAAFDVDVDAKELDDVKTDVGGWEGVRQALEKHLQESENFKNGNTEFGSVDGDGYKGDSYADEYGYTEHEDDEDVYIVVEGPDGRPELIRRPDDELEDEEVEEEDVNEEDEDEDEDGMEFQSLRGAIKGAIKIGTKLIKGGVKVIKKGARVIKNVGRKTVRGLRHVRRKYGSHIKRFAKDVGEDVLRRGAERVFNTDGDREDYERRESEEEGYEEQDGTGEGDDEPQSGPVRGNRGGTRVRAAPVFVRKSGNGPAVERAPRGRPSDRGSDEEEDEE